MVRGGPVGERQRKAHRKSRAGCDQCKKRHYKCDEARPKCSGCSKRKIECSFKSAQSPASDVSVNTRVFSSISHNITSHHADLNGPLPMEDFELLHNSITSTRYTITPETNPQEDDFSVAFAFPYLMHTTLALSALHLYSKQPHRPELISRAASHQHAALTLVRPHIIELTAEHSKPVLLFSAITSIFALAEPAYDPQGFGTVRDPIEELLNSFHLSRGIRTILKQRWDVFRTTEVGAKTVLKDYTALKSTLDEDYPMYPTLRDLASQQCDAEEVSACNHALEKLFLFLAINEKFPLENPGPMYVQMWPIDVDIVVLEMMAMRHPVALVILAYYAAFMRTRSTTWWLCKWPAAIMQCVAENLDPEWAAMLEWPRNKLSKLDQVASSLLEVPTTEPAITPLLEVPMEL